MEGRQKILVETRLESDGRLTLTGLPYRAGDHLIVQIEAAPSSAKRRFPMRGRPYRLTDPFAPATSPDEWEVMQ